MLRFIVLIGTFSLAMAFAGNDLVNFIGVPLAGYNSWELYTAGGASADQFLMGGLAGKVPTPTLLLLLAGIVMVITLWTSTKARSVVKTSLDLGVRMTVMNVLIPMPRREAWCGHSVKWRPPLTIRCRKE